MGSARAESCSSGQRRGLAAPIEDRISSPGQKSFRISTTSATRGREQRTPRSIPPRTVWKPQPHWMVANWRGLMGSARGESCPPGQRRGLAAPVEDKFPSADQNSFHICITPTTRGRKRRSPGSVPPRAVWKLQPHWPMADCLGLMEPVREIFLLRSISLPLQQAGDENAYPRSRYRAPSLADC